MLKSQVLEGYIIKLDEAGATSDEIKVIYDEFVSAKQDEARSFAAAPRPEPIREVAPPTEGADTMQAPIHQELANTLQKLIDESISKASQREASWQTPVEPTQEEQVTASMPTAEPESTFDINEDLLTWFEELEGVGKHKDIAGNPTNPYGVLNTLGLKKEEEEDDRAFAKRLAIAYRNKMESIVPEIKEAPIPVQQAAMSMMWNTGNLFSGQKKDIKKGNYMGFASNLLDVVTVSDGEDLPKDEKGEPTERWVVGGLLNRRAKEYNKVAAEAGAEPIVSYEVKDNGDNTVTLIYTTKSGARLMGGIVKGKDKKLVIKGKKQNDVN